MKVKNILRKKLITIILCIKYTKAKQKISYVIEKYFVEYFLLAIANIFKNTKNIKNV